MGAVETEIEAVLAALSAQPALFDEDNFARRAEALDELEFHVLDRLDDLLAAAPSAGLHPLRRQALALQEQLEAADQRLFQRLRASIRAGHYTPEGLRAQLVAYAPPGEAGNTPEAATDYDALDVLTNGLFPEPGELPEAEAQDPEMVYYQKTPARIVLALAAKIGPADTFYDLGSGLGQVPLLVRLLSGATAVGIEIEPAYCQHARACAEALGLSRVTFCNADARGVSYADGTVFFLFTPFTGRLLASVLEKLRQVAQGKAIKIFSYGPGTQALANQEWLRRVDAPDSHLYQLAEFRSR